MTIGVVWFRRDLRLLDNPAWAAATRRHHRVVALYVVEPGLRDAVFDNKIPKQSVSLGARTPRFNQNFSEV